MSKQWTNKEIARLCHLYPRTRKGDSLAAEFPGRTEASIANKAAYLKLRRGTLVVCQAARKRRSMWAAIADRYEPVIFGGEM